MRLKVGDKVIVIDDREGLGVGNKIGIIKIDDESTKPYKVYFEDIDRECWFCEDQLKLVVNKKPTKQELLDMPAGTKIYTDAEAEDYQVWLKKIDGDFCNEYNDTFGKYDIEDDLKLNLDVEDYGTKIIKIEKPIYETVYDSSTEVQEMTIAEIEKALGHAVKIIKEGK